MWPIAGFVRGLSVDEAIKQLSFIKLKGAFIAKEVSGTLLIYLIHFFIFIYSFNDADQIL